MMDHIMAPTITRELTNSPDALLWLHLRDWFQSRQAPVEVMWVRGHSGEAGNERADHLADLAHDDPDTTIWTARMPPPPGASFWIMHVDRVIPRRPRRLFREQDQVITHKQLIDQVNAVPNRPVQSSEEVDHILQILRWTVLSNGQTEKRSAGTSPTSGTARYGPFDSSSSWDSFRRWLDNKPGIRMCTTAPS
jgi:hypothetical protein